MTNQLLPLWELVLNGVQIILCVMIFIFLIHSKIKYKRWILNAAAQETTPAFSDEIRIQHLKQLTEKSFDAVVDTINQERMALQTCFDASESESGQSVSVLPTSDDFKTLIPEDETNPGDTDLTNFSEIIALADKGLSIREISKRLNMPSGEVELVVRLNKDDVEDKHGHVLRAKA